VSNFLFDLTNVDGEAETRSSKYDDVKPKLDTSDTGDIVYIGARPASDIFKLVDKEDDSAIHREYTFHVLSSDFDAKPIMQWRAVSTHEPSFRPLFTSDFRVHISKQMSLNPQSFTFWFGDSRELPVPGFGNEVRIVLDPFIRLRLQTPERVEVHTLDFSRRKVNKATIPLKDIRVQVRETLKSKPNDPLLLFSLHDEKLEDDNLSLKETGLLSPAQLDGCEEIVLDLEFQKDDHCCVLCTDDKPIASFPAWVTFQCDHTSNICLDCVRTWIEHKLNDGEHDKITCPECNRPLSHIDVENLATEEQFAKYVIIPLTCNLTFNHGANLCSSSRYDKLITRNYLLNLDEFRWCLSPDCSSGQLHQANHGDIFICAACNFRHCVKHNIPWHEGETCAEYDYRTDGSLKRKEEQASEHEIGRSTQTCPKESCGARIHKMTGCDHMVCSRCRTNFCYVCGAADAEIAGHYSQGSHKPTCPYYVRRDRNLF